MGKANYESPPPIFAVVGSLRPEAATRYRLIDSQNRVFPPNEHPAFVAFPRIDLPAVPAGAYRIRFETTDTTVVPALGDDPTPLIQLAAYAEVTGAPADIAVYNERRWQKAEKREYRYAREGMANEALQNAYALLAETQRQLGESHAAILGMTKTFMTGQQHLLEQQNELMKRTATMTPPQKEDWSGALKTLIVAAQDIAKTGLVAAAQRNVSREVVRDALPKQNSPKAALQASSANSSPERGAWPSAPTDPAHAFTAPEPPNQPVASPAVEPAEAEPVAQVIEAASAEVVPANGAALASTPKPPEDQKSRQAQEQQEQEQEPEPATVNPCLAAWREIKRRVVQVTDEGIGWILSSPENFADFFVYLANACPPAEVFAAEVPA
jgi:hypothetical protein